MRCAIVATMLAAGILSVHAQGNNRHYAELRCDYAVRLDRNSSLPLLLQQFGGNVAVSSQRKTEIYETDYFEQFKSLYPSGMEATLFSFRQ
jgi:hypothetical protein